MVSGAKLCTVKYSRFKSCVGSVVWDGAVN